MPHKTRDIANEILTPSAIALISITQPYIGVLATFIYGAAKVIQKWKYDRMEEVYRNVGGKKLLDLINKDDKMRDILHKILQNVMDESSEQKRKFFYSYIHNLTKDLHSEFDYHTKLISVLNQITLDEFDILVIFANHFDEMLKLNGRSDNNAKIPNGLNVGQIMKYKGFDQMDPGLLDNFLTTLSAYGLLYSGFGALGGTTFGPTTYFGRVFIDFIESEENHDG